MCATCGCSGEQHHHDHHHGDADHHHHAHHHEGGEHAHDDARRTVRLERELLAKNARLASENRRELAATRVSLFNLIGAPGAGKTALLEAAVRRLAPDLGVVVLEGDQATDRDARRIEAAGCRSLQINTGTGCHLDASMIRSGLRALAPSPGSVVFVENVGNLVCPALFDLGELARVVVMSITEGEDKPLKYPHVFRDARLLVLTKIDLQPLVRLDERALIEHAQSINPHIRVLRTSARDGAGTAAFSAWVRDEARRGPRAERRAGAPPA